MYVSAIIVAAGSSSRMGTGISKQFSEIHKEPVIKHTLRAFEKASRVSELIVVCRSEDLEQIEKIAKSIPVTKPIAFVFGGACRHESVLNGISSTNEIADYYAIHDGARPLITPEQIDELINSAFKHQCVAPGIAVTDTIKEIDLKGYVKRTPQRSNLRAVQTPQIFKKELYLKALEKAKNAGAEFTDDCMLLEFSGEKVYIAKGSRENIKITVPEDIKCAEIILDKR